MIVTQTPLRISLFGGGTDLADYYRRAGGSVLSFAIDKHVHVAVKPRWDDELVVNHWTQERTGHVHDIRNGVIRECLVAAGISGGLEISCMSDVPAGGSGLGSSSALAVGLLNALLAYQGAAPGPAELAEAACRIEIDVLGQPIGKQDQYAAAFGDWREYRFHPDGSVTAQRVLVPAAHLAEFHRHALILYTGRTRRASDILSDQKANIDRRLDQLHALKSHVATGHELLLRGEVRELGRLLDESWQRKRELSDKIHDQQLDTMYERARQAGAYGGKLLGAGGGGFFLFLCPPHRHAQVRAALGNPRQMTFSFDRHGSTVLLNTRAAALVTT
ncbi:GHMP kinase [Phytohabitans flavus]|uniref:GHMP kinase n=1 Tax=Phytohabitans flavus TaxID=1076124 RepID=A0A6F8XS56_9ACTN|nr:GHMP kinase [Phytohabitans flavus]BCB76627.1 GHMP kinase [Phytohabitans flavus]